MGPKPNYGSPSQRQWSLLEQVKQLHREAVTHRKAGRFAEALDLLHEAEKLAPNNTFVLGDLGYIHRKRHEYSLAASYFLRALKVQPANKFILDGLAITYREMGDFPQAIHYFKQNLALEPHDKQALDGLAITYREMGAYGQAVESYQKLLELFPDSVYGLVGLGDVYRAAGQKEEALRWYEKALEFARQNRKGAQSLIRAGRVAQDLGQVADAAHYYEVAMEYDKDNRSLKRRVEQLRKEKEAAEEKLRLEQRKGAMSRVALSVIHEIRQPLGAILYKVQFLRRRLERNQLERPETLAGLSETEQYGKRLDTLLSRFRILAWSKEKIKTEKVDLNAVVSNVLLELAEQLMGNKIKVAQNLAPSRPFILADKILLEVVLINLLTNAREAMSAKVGLSQITLTTLVADEQVSLTVADTGPGISPEHLPKLFEDEFTTKGNDRGLGLYISHQIVTECGGQIAVTSTVGEGTTIHLTFPQVKETAQDTLLAA